MLTSGAAKTCQHVVRRIISSCHGQVSDGSAHGLVCNLHKSQSNLRDGFPHIIHVYIGVVCVDLFGNSGKRIFGSLRSQFLVFVRSKYLWEKRWNDSTQYQVRIGNRQWSTIQITHRSGKRSGGLWSNFHHSSLELQDTATSGSHGVDIELWRLYVNSSGDIFKDMFKFTIVSGNIRGSASHIESDHGLPIEMLIRGVHITDHATCWTG
mmetsp:Transcript_43846/g.70308  ORF Transcript_43846/g.70308 Transcript_43846/m.70308 type:complete len:209 (+) Transcript_43846:250-876(+)